MSQESHNSNICPLNNQYCPVVERLEELQEKCERLQELSETDSLTGFFNFRHLRKALGDEMERTRRTGLPTALIMIDLDYFKRINDTYGHEIGNDALKWCSSIWRGIIRKIDIPCRYGGEEFAIILPSTRLAPAVRAAERLRKAIAESAFVVEGVPVALTASFGVNVFNAKDQFSVEDFIKKTDFYLLKAKEMGRNCVRYPGLDKVEEVSTELTTEEREALLPNRSQ